MKKLITTICLLFTLLPVANANISEKTIKSVVQIITNTTQGSGVIISEDGFLLTNHHVIKGADKILICINENFFNEPKCAHTANIVGSDENIDIALLQINHSNEEFSYLNINEARTLRFGDTIKAIGFPDMGGNTLTMTEGNFSGIESARLKHNAITSAGISGGALLDKNNQLVGLNVAVNKGRDATISLAISIETIRVWIVEFAHLLNDTSLFGDTEEEIVNATKKVEYLVKYYDKKVDESQLAHNSLYYQFEQQKAEQEKKLKNVIETLKSRTLISKNHYHSLVSTWESFAYIDKSYEIAEARKKIMNLEEEFEQEKNRLEKICKNNIEIISNNQKQALSETDYTYYRKLHKKSKKMLIDLKNKRTKIRYRDRRLRKEAEKKKAEEEAEKAKSESISIQKSAKKDNRTLYEKLITNSIEEFGAMSKPEKRKYLIRKFRNNEITLEEFKEILRLVFK